MWTSSRPSVHLSVWSVMGYNAPPPDILLNVDSVLLAYFLINNLEFCSMPYLSNEDLSEDCPFCSQHLCNSRVLTRCHETNHTCSDLSHCGAAIRIGVCRPVFSAQCLICYILDGVTVCTTCKRGWFRPAGDFERNMVLRESQLCKWYCGSHLSKGQGCLLPDDRT